MDISVRHLNSRMAVQVPLELPLGLVFVVGRVENLQQTTVENGGVTFELVEKGYRLRCRLSPRATTNIALMEHARARAGGHLMFDPTTASYFLVARDVEILPASNRPPIPRSELNSILTDIKKRAEATHLTVSALPYWVQKMAPPEVRTELGLGPETEPADNSAAAHTLSLDEPEALPPQIDQEILSFLSKAMDSDEDVELTSDILTRLAPDAAPNAEVNAADAAVADAAVAASAAVTNVAKTQTPPALLQTPPIPPPPIAAAPPASNPSTTTRPAAAREGVPPPQTAPVRMSMTNSRPEVIQASSNREPLLLVIIVLLALTLLIVMLLLFLSL